MKRFLSVVLAVGVLGVAAGMFPVSAADAEQDYALKCTVEYKSEPTEKEPVYGGLSLNGYDFFRYQFAVGDVIEYEVYLEDKIPGLGNLDMQVSKLVSVADDGYETHEWRMFKASKEFPDQPVVMDEDGRPVQDMTDLTDVAYQKWYKRRIPVPELYTGDFTTRHWAVKTGANVAMGLGELKGTTATVYYKNIRVVDKDGNVKMTIIGPGQKYYSSELFDFSGVAMKAEAVTDYPGASPADISSDETSDSSKLDNVTSAPVGLWAGIAAAVAVVIAIIVVILVVIKKKDGKSNAA